MSGDVTQISIPKCYPPSINPHQSGGRFLFFQFFIFYNETPPRAVRSLTTPAVRRLDTRHHLSPRPPSPCGDLCPVYQCTVFPQLCPAFRCITQRKILHEIAALKQSLFVLSGKRPCSEMRVLRYAISLMACTRICFGLPDLVGINSEGNALIEMAANLPLLQRLTGAYFMRQFILTLLLILKFTN